MNKITAFIFLLCLSFPALAQQWEELGTGTRALNADNNIGPMVADKRSDNFYAAGSFTNALGKYYVARWNGVSWSELGTGTNGLNANNRITGLVMDAQDNLYAAGWFGNSAGSKYVAKWDGISWSELKGADGGLKAKNYIKDMAINDSGHIYVSAYTGYNSQARMYQHVVAKWDGENWSYLDTLNTVGDADCIAVDQKGNVYLAGGMQNANGDYYVAQWNHATKKWAELGSGSPLGANDLISDLLVDNDGNLYCSGYFYFGSSWDMSVAKWDGSSWSEVGQGISARYIVSLAKDSAGHIYAGASSGVYQWDGTSWVAKGGSFSDFLTGVYADNTGNFYANGYFKNSDGEPYIAVFTKQNAVAIDSVVVSTVANAPLLITKNVTSTLNMAANVFPSTANQNVNWSVLPVTGSATINPLGILTAQATGEVWVKAVSVIDTTKMDSLMVTIRDSVGIDSVRIRTVKNVAAEIKTVGGILDLEALVYPSSKSQDVTWSVSSPDIASISVTGVMRALDDGTVWVKAISVEDPTRLDSLKVLVSGQKETSIGSMDGESRFTVYPNPTSGLLQIQGTPVSGKMRAMVTVYTLTGIQILEKTIDSTDAEINVSHLTPGIYILRYTGDDQIRWMQRFTKL